MEELGELLGIDFLRNAVLVGVLASLLCGVLGTFVVTKRLVFLSGGVAHAAFAGIGLGLFLGFDPRLGAVSTAVVAALVLVRTGVQADDARPDAIIGILWAVGMAVGIVFLHLTPGTTPELSTYLFGNLLAVGGDDVVLTAGLVVLALAFVAAFYKELLAVSFDQDFATVQGVPASFLLTALVLLVAVAVVLLLQVVGIVLVVAMLSIPPMVGLRLSSRFPTVVLLATLAGLVMVLGGLTASYLLDLPSGATIVLAGLALLLLAAAGQRRGAG